MYVGSFVLVESFLCCSTGHIMFVTVQYFTQQRKEWDEGSEKREGIGGERFTKDLHKKNKKGVCEREIGGKGRRFGVTLTVFVLVFASPGSAFHSELSTPVSVQEVCVIIRTDCFMTDGETRATVPVSLSIKSPVMKRLWKCLVSDTMRSWFVMIEHKLAMFVSHRSLGSEQRGVRQNKV